MQRDVIRGYIAILLNPIFPFWTAGTDPKGTPKLHSIWKDSLHHKHPAWWGNRAWRWVVRCRGFDGGLRQHWFGTPAKSGDSIGSDFHIKRIGELFWNWCHRLFGSQFALRVVWLRAFRFRDVDLFFYTPFDIAILNAASSLQPCQSPKRLLMALSAVFVHRQPIFVNHNLKREIRGPWRYNLPIGWQLNARDRDLAQAGGCYLFWTFWCSFGSNDCADLTCSLVKCLKLHVTSHQLEISHEKPGKSAIIKLTRISQWWLARIS